MGRQAVEEVLAVTALHRLLTLKHLVKEDIYLGVWSAGIIELELKLTRDGLKKCLCGNTITRNIRINTALIDGYHLNHNKLKEAYDELNGQKRS